MVKLTFTTNRLSDASFVTFAIRTGESVVAEVWVETSGQVAEPLERLLRMFPAGTSKPLVNLQSAFAPLRSLDWSDPRTEGTFVVTRAQTDDLRFAVKTFTGFNYPPGPDEVDRAKSRLVRTMELILPR